MLIRDGSTAAQEVGAAVISELAHGAADKFEKEKALEKANNPDKKDGEKGEGEEGSFKTSKEPSRRASKDPMGAAPPMRQAPADAPSAAAPAGAPAAATPGEEEGEDGPVVVGRLAEIAAAGGILPLVGLLTTGSPVGKEHAAQALWYLSVDPTTILRLQRRAALRRSSSCLTTVQSRRMTTRRRR